MNKTTKAQFPHSLGVFSPTGHVVMAFSDDASAERAQQELIHAGFDENDVTHYNRYEVMTEFQKSEKHAVDPVQIGQEVAKVETYIELCNRGCGFLVVHAPRDAQSKRAVEIARPFGLKFAEKYNRLTLEELA